MKDATDPPPGLIPVPMKGATQLLTEREFTARIRAEPYGHVFGHVTGNRPGASLGTF